MTPGAVSLWAPVAVVAAGIFVLSSLSQPPGPSTFPDWILHGIEYGVLGFLLARALAGGLRRRPAVRVALATVALGLAYGVTDEVHQAFVPSREASARDVTADVGGTLLGLGVASLVSISLAPRRRNTIEVTLITAPACPLCEEARSVLREVARCMPLTVTERSIRDDPELQRRYAEQVPVVMVGDRRVAKGKVDRARLARSLAARQSAIT